ncbi:MAG TPA: aminotransferase class IV [Gaiellaceae bacterium]|nr:aminotransferase class IV [Gaiellaceae bacterium]
MSLVAVAVAGRGLVDPAEPVFGADDEALLRGAAAFETIRVYGGRPFLLAEHLERLSFSAAALALAPPDGAEKLVELVGCAAPPDHVLRLYRTSRLLVATAAELPPGLDEARAEGIALRSFEVGAPPPLLGGAKTTSYGVSFAARREAERLGADDALLVGEGLVLEAATANVWWRRGGRLYTPASRAGVLPGVTRAFLASLEPVQEGAFPLDDLLAADEAFTTSSVREVMPVVAVDGRPIGDGRPGPAAARLQAALRLRSAP